MAALNGVTREFRLRKLEQCYDNNKTKRTMVPKIRESCRIFVNSHESEETRTSLRGDKIVDGAGPQQAHNKQANGDTKDVETCRIFAKKKYENEEQFTAKLWLERRFNSNTGARKPERKQQGRKIR